MNIYNAVIAIQGNSIKTAVFANSVIHARLILQYQFGMNSIVAGPMLSTKSCGTTK